MTNNEQALKIIEENSWYNAVSDNPYVYDYTAKEAIELAAKPDWYYPSKGEFPKFEINKRFLVTLYENEGRVEEVYFHDDEVCYSKENDEFYSWSEVKAWTYLPKFEE